MKRGLLAILALSVLVLAGCTGGDPQAQSPSALPFIGGVQGLVISFAEGMPPIEVFDEGQSVFSIGVIIENVGESAIGAGSNNDFGYVEILGINPGQFGYDGTNGRSADDLKQLFSNELSDLRLQGARRGFDGSVVPGDITLVEFQDFSYTPNRFGNADVTVRANVCYEYKTYVDAQICFKDSLLENAQDATICELSGPKPFSSSAAPVQITQVSQNPAGSEKIQVTFILENVGGGALFAPPEFLSDTNAYTPGSYTPSLNSLCDFNVGANVIRDVVGVQVSLGSFDTPTSNIEIDCPLLRGGDSGYVRLYQGAPATVTCTVDLDRADNSPRIFTDSLLVALSYTYNQFVEQPLLVRDTNVGFEEPILN